MMAAETKAMMKWRALMSVWRLSVLLLPEPIPIKDMTTISPTLTKTKINVQPAMSFQYPREKERTPTAAHVCFLGFNTIKKSAAIKIRDMIKPMDVPA